MLLGASVVLGAATGMTDFPDLSRVLNFSDVGSPRASLGVGAGRAQAGPIEPLKKAPSAIACRNDSDCTLVPDDCCPCSAGGRQRAIPAKDKEAYQRAQKERCADTMCAAVMSTDPSCSATKAVCKSGTCALGGPPPPSAGG